MANPIGKNGIGVSIIEKKVDTFVVNTVDINALCVIGEFQSGPINKATELFNFESFKEMFGDYVEGSEAWLQVYIFFQLYAGRRVVVIRVAHYTDITLSSTLSAVRSTLKLDDLESITGASTAIYVTGVTTVDVDGTSGDILPSASPVGAYIEFTGGDKLSWTGTSYVSGTDTTTLTGVTWDGVVGIALDETFVYSEASSGVDVEAKWAGSFGNDIKVEVEETSNVNTLTTNELANGGTSVDLTTVVGIEIGEVINIGAGTVYVQVTDIVDRTIKFEAVALSGPIALGAVVVNLRNTLAIYYKGVLTDEVYVNVSLWEENLSFYIETMLSGSKYIKISITDADQAVHFWQRQLKDNSGGELLAGGSNGGALVDNDYIGHLDSKTGLWALDLYKRAVTITQPDATTAAVARATVQYCFTELIHSTVLDIPHNLTVSGAKNYSDSIVGIIGDMAKHYCWSWTNIGITHPDTNQVVRVHPSGSIVGARSVVSGTTGLGPWNEAAGNPHGVLRGVVELETNVINGEDQLPTNDDSVIEDLQLSKINPIVFDENVGFMLYGSLTGDRRQPTDPNALTHISQSETRRMVYATLKNYFDNLLFKNNDRSIRDSALQSVGKKGRGWYQLGAFSGDTFDEAFSMKCDTENNPLAIRQIGKFVFHVSLSKNDPINRIDLIFTAQAVNLEA